MSERRDRRRRTDLDLFVLALIADGEATAYELQKSAGLSQGAAIPALQRLLKAGLIEQATPGARRRTEHRITRDGRKFLKGGSLALINDGPNGDLDADLRVALLALRAGANRRLAVDFLRKSADKKSQSRIGREVRQNADAPVPLGLWYRRLRSVAADAIFKGEAEAALAMAETLPRNLSRNTRLGKQGNSTRRHP
jgi:DNA-binding PadR family transcriptional regulator